MKNSTFYADVLDARASVIDSLSTATYSASASYQYDAYGNRVGSSAGTAAVSPYGYDGYYTDSESGLCYLNARYYDPSTQCFTQEDTYWGTVGDPGSRNLYGYCQDNPVNYSDPTGHRISAEDHETDEELAYDFANQYRTSSGYEPSHTPEVYLSQFANERNGNGKIKENATVKQLNTYLGVRATKNDNASEMGSINSGERLQVLSDDGYFAYVRYHIKASPCYKEGYVHSRYLQKDGATKAAAKPAVKAKAKSANTKAASKAKGTSQALNTISLGAESASVGLSFVNAIKQEGNVHTVNSGGVNQGKIRIWSPGTTDQYFTKSDYLFNQTKNALTGASNFDRACIFVTMGVSAVSNVMQYGVSSKALESWGIDSIDGLAIGAASAIIVSLLVTVLAISAPASVIAISVVLVGLEAQVIVNETGFEDFQKQNLYSLTQVSN